MYFILFSKKSKKSHRLLSLFKKDLEISKHTEKYEKIITEDFNNGYYTIINTTK